MDKESPSLRKQQYHHVFHWLCARTVHGDNKVVLNLLQAVCK